ncbi:MAG TPA: S41 family peptidase, partial [Candidatus Kapabacteria bacterium]|nr:S41 family peptidase [Candidatus Kapabacteria bacterium]
MFRQTVLDQLIQLIEEHYVFPAKIPEIVSYLRSRMPVYAEIRLDRAFALAITTDLYTASQDVHLALHTYVPDRSMFDPSITARVSKKVGIVHIAKFPALRGSKGVQALEEFNSAFKKIEEATGILIDVRRNEGSGDGASVALAISYLIPSQSVLLAEYRNKTGRNPDESWSWEKLPSENSYGAERPLVNVPLCVLVGSKTFSAAEEFAYTLQQMKRATIIGERTKGSAHPARLHVIDASFRATIPYAETINPISGTNWEASGVIPDIECSNADTLEIAMDFVKPKII